MSVRVLVRLAGAGLLLTGSLAAAPSPAAAGALATSVAASAQAAVGTFHPYSTLALPDVVVAQMGLSHAEVDGAPRAAGIAGPLYVPAAGLLGLLGLPQVPPGLLPYCQSAFPGEPASVSCVGPRQDAGGVIASAGNGYTESGGDFTDLSKLFSFASVRLAGAQSEAFSAGAGRTSAEVKPVDNRWVAGASLEMQQVVIGDVVTIDSIASSATGALNGEPGSGAASNRLSVVGAKVAGQSVDITPDGVVVAGQPGMSTDQAKTLQQTVDSALQQARVSVRLLPANKIEVAEDGTAVTADSGGVVIGFDAPQPVPPATGIEVILGRSTVRMSAYNADAAISGPEELGSSGGGDSAGSPASDATSTPQTNGSEPSTGAPSPADGAAAASSTTAAGTGLSTPEAATSYGDLADTGAPAEIDSPPGTARDTAPVETPAATTVGSGSPEGSPPGSFESSQTVGDAPAAPEPGVAIPTARSAALADNDGWGVRHAFLVVAILAVAGPVLAIARRIRLVFGG